MQFLHFGVPTTEDKPGMTLLEALGVYVTDPGADPFMIEWLRFLPDSPMDKMIQSQPHAAYMVDDLDEAMKKGRIICEPFSPGPGTRLAFIDFNGAVVELMESKPAASCGCGCE